MKRIYSIKYDKSNILQNQLNGGSLPHVLPKLPPPLPPQKKIPQVLCYPFRGSYGPNRPSATRMYPQVQVLSPLIRSLIAVVYSNW